MSELLNQEQRQLSSKELALSIKDQILSGDLNPLEAMSFLKKVQKVAEELGKIPTIKDMLLIEIRRHLGNAKEAKAYGAKVSISPYVRYDYGASGHPEYDEICLIIKELEIRKKEIEEELKLLKGKKDIIITHMPKLVFEESGEIVEVTEPPYSAYYENPIIST